MKDTPITAPLSPLRSFPSHAWLWSGLFIILAGPLNPAAWMWARPANGNLILIDYTAMAWIVLMPCTIMALAMQNMMWSMPVFLPKRIWTSALIGLILATIAGPIGFSISEITSGTVDVIDGINLIFISFTFGIFFGVIPHFLITLGIPCMFAAVIVAFLCTRSAVRPAPNTTLPKRTKPL